MKMYSVAAVLVGAALVRAQSASPAATLSVNPTTHAIICNNTDGGTPFSGSVCQGSQAIISCSAGVGVAIALSNTTAFPTPTGTVISASPSCYQKDGNNAFPAFDNTVYESGTSYTISGSAQTGTSSSSSSSTSEMGTTTSTVLSTQTFTITSCHPTVTSCPANMATYTSLSESVVTITSVITTDTTYCPESEATSTPVEVPIVVQPTPTPPPVPIVEQPSAPAQAETYTIPAPAVTPVVPVQPGTPQSTPAVCTEGCHVETILSSIVYVVPTPHYAAGNKTTPLPTGGSPAPNYVVSGASANNAGSLAAALGFLVAALF